MSRRRQTMGDYYGGSTVLSRSGWGFSKPERSPKKKELERIRKNKAEAAAFFDKQERERQGKRRPKAT